MTTTFWTQTLTLGWRPTVGYYENRFRYLRDLEERELVAAFRVDENNNVEVKLVDPHHQATLGAESIVLDVATPTGDWARCATALDLAVSHSQPKSLRYAGFQFQLVVPVEEMDYDTARREHAGAWLNRPIIDTLTSSDVAVLVDFATTDGFASAQVEFGVINDEELGPRIARQYGRTRGVPRPRGQLGELAEEVPPVALFLDINWNVKSLPAVGDMSKWVDSARNRLIKESVALADALQIDAGG